MTKVALNRNRNRSHPLAHSLLATVALLFTAPLYSPSFHLLRVFFFCLFFFLFVRTSLSHITQVMCNTCIICEWGRTEYVWKWDSKRRYKALRNQINETMCLHTVDMLFPLCVPWRLVECDCVCAYACHTCTMHACIKTQVRGSFNIYLFGLVWFGFGLRSHAVACINIRVRQPDCFFGSHLFIFCSAQLYGISNIAVYFLASTQTRHSVWNIINLNMVFFFSHLLLLLGPIQFFSLSFNFFALWASLIVHFDKYKFDIRCAKCLAIKAHDGIIYPHALPTKRASQSASQPAIIIVINVKCDFKCAIRHIATVFVCLLPIQSHCYASLCF